MVNIILHSIVFFRVYGYFWVAKQVFWGALGYLGVLIRLTIRWEGHILGFKDKNVRG